jgi:hypothetical protein
MARSQAIAIQNNGFPYRGALVVVAVPRGSEWSLTLSGVPVVRAPRSYSDGANFRSYPDNRHGVGQPPFLHVRRSMISRTIRTSARKAQRLVEAARQPA